MLRDMAPPRRDPLETVVSLMVLGGALSLAVLVLTLLMLAVIER